MKSKHVVTGANGFIGNALCWALHDQDKEVIAVVRPGSNRKAERQKPFANIVECDISEYAKLPDLIGDDIETFYHFAWDGSSGSALSQLEKQASNIIWTSDAVDAASELRAQKFVFASSVISNETIKSFQDNEWMSPNSVYGAIKMASNLIACEACEKKGMHYCEALISNVYGPGENSPRLINTTIRKLVKGDHCSFTSATQMYDFIFINDAARAISLIGCSPTMQRTYYIGSNIRPLSDYLEILKEVVSPKAFLGIGELEGEERHIDYSSIDTGALTREFNFSCETSFRSGIATTRDWILKTI